MRDVYTTDQLRKAPKVLLHDHIDGGLRPATVIEQRGSAVGHIIDRRRAGIRRVTRGALAAGAGKRRGARRSARG